MTEIRCEICRKVCAYLKAGSKIANGTAMYCLKCKPGSGAHDHEIPAFLRGFRVKK